MIPGRVSPSLALAAYAEAWISGAKVVVFGNALSPLPERLIERGARLVQVYDSDSARVAEATARGRSTQICHAPVEQAGAGGRDGAYEVGIVEDLTAAGSDADALLQRLSHALSRRGLALVASQNPEVKHRLIEPEHEADKSLTYYELYDAVGKHFEEVRMLGQTPFVGYAVADFSAADDADIRLDTAFLPGGAEEPEWFLALASAMPTAAEGFTVIQLPAEDVAAGGGRQQAQRAREAEKRSVARIVELEVALKASQAAAARKLNVEQSRETERLNAELAKREEWLSSLESRAATADSRADAAQAELEALESSSARAQKALERKLAASDKARDEAAQASKAQQDASTALRKEVAQLRQNLEREDQKRRELERASRSLEQRLAQLTAELESRAQHDADAKADTARREADAARREKQRLAEQRLAEQRLAEQRLAEQHLAEQRLAEQRLAEQRLAEQRLADEQRRSEQAQAEDAQADDAIAIEYEARLTERAREVARLENELHQAKRLGRQLIADLQALRAEGQAPASTEQLEALMQRNAVLEADLEAARWSVTALERNRGSANGEALAAPTLPKATDVQAG